MKNRIIIGLITLNIILTSALIWQYFDKKETPIIQWVVKTNTQESMTSSGIKIEVEQLVMTGGNSVSGTLTIDTKKEFNIDDFVSSGSYQIVKKETKWNITVYSIHEKSITPPDCFDDTPCVSFVTQNKKLKYTNLKTPWKIELSNLINQQSFLFFKMYTNGIVFEYDWWGELIECSGWSYTDLVYVDTKTLQRIYQKYSEWQVCDWYDSTIATASWWVLDCKKVCKKLTQTKTKEFFDENKNPLNLKSTNMEAAYIEHYKKNKKAPSN